MKKIYLSLLTSIAIITVGCSHQPYIPEPTKNHEVVKTTASGTYLGYFGEKFIDIDIKGEKTMFVMNDDLKKKIVSIEPKSSVSIEYHTDTDEQNILTSLKVTSSPSPTKEPEEKEKPKEDKKDKDAFITFLSASNEKVKLPATLNDSSQGYNILIADGYNFSKASVGSDEISSSDTPKASFSIEWIEPNTYIKKERWDAADILKQHGDLKEIINDYDAEFIFESKSNAITKRIYVISRDQQLYRVNLEYSNSNEDSLPMMEAMINTIKN